MNEGREEPKVVFDFKSGRDAKQFAKDVENSGVGLANKGVERYKGKYRVVITGMTKDMHKKAIGKYAHKNKGEFSHSSSEVTPKGYGPYDESVELDEESHWVRTSIPASKQTTDIIEHPKSKILWQEDSALGNNSVFVVIQRPLGHRGELRSNQDKVLMATISDPQRGRIKMFAFHGTHVNVAGAKKFAKNNGLLA